MSLLSDVRIAIRRLLSTPGFTAVGVLALALGLGATSAVLTMVRAVLYDSLPFERPEQLVQLSGRMLRETEQDWPMGYQDLQELRAQNSFIGPAAVTALRSFNMLAGDVVEHVRGEMVSHDYFSILSVGLVHGRMFSETEASAATPASVVVLGEGLWRTRFGGDTRVIGTTIRLNDLPYEVIGIAAPRFRGLTDNAELWLPIGMAGRVYGEHYTANRQFRWLFGVARLRDGVTLDAAQSTSNQLTQRLAESYPVDNRGFRAQLQALPDAFVGGWRRPLAIVLGAAAFVLLIACTNVANLLLVRGISRRHELAVCTALGAGRGRLVRQMVVESIVLVGIAAVLGQLLANGALSAIIATGGLDLASFIDVSVDQRVLGAAIALSLLCGILSGLAPALLVTRVSPIEAMKEAAVNTTMGRARRAFQATLLGAQVALALALLVGASLMVSGFSRFVRTDLGWSAERVLSARLDLTSETYRDNERYTALVDNVLERVRAVPGVRGVALEGPGMPTGGSFGLHFQRPDHPDDDFFANRHHVSPDYFATLEIPVTGRTFTSADRGTSGDIPIILSRRLANLIYPNEDVIGRELRATGSDTRLTIVGVANDVMFGGAGADATAAPDVYLPILRSPARTPPIITLLLRYDGAEGSVRDGLDRAVREAAPSLPLFDVRPLTDLLAEQTSTPRLLVRLVALFSLLALTLAGIGVYGVVGFTVTHRMRELGIRVALGAERADILRTVLQSVALPIGAGIIAGLAAALLLRRTIETLLYGVEGIEVLPVVIAAVVMIGAAFAAALPPARRAFSADPRSVLGR